MTRTKYRKESANIGNRGFTLLEALLGLTTFCLMGILFPLAFQMFNNIDFNDGRLQTLQWEVFSNQIKKEIRLSQKITSKDTKLELSIDGNSILYEKNGSNLRRRVNLTGNEILLQNIYSVNFTKVKNGVVIEVADLQKSISSVTVRTFIDIE
ncbi:competence type IV pilus minor pilin ComGF [Pseudoneobacillus sp. C159]